MAPLRQGLDTAAGKYCIFSLPATDNLKLILVVCGPNDIEVGETDRQMLAVLLSLGSVSLENLILLEESKRSMVRLEDFKDHLIALERAATQGMMSSEIAHELNNFIAIILSNIELFEMKAAGSYPESAAKYLENVKKHVDKIEKFTSSLSAAGKMLTNRQATYINEMIQEIVSFARHQKRFRNAQISAELDPALPPAFVDPSQMQQVLYNLLNNAADAIGHDRRDGRIQITTKFDQQSNELP